ncbi:unnamed protein product [Polarella glacialis]|nr:unnamed protein product [Polarella glacialis]
MTEWMSTYPELRVPAPVEVREEPLPREEGGPSRVCALLWWKATQGGPEVAHLLRRARPFSSTLLSTERNLLEREYRFHRELADVVATSCAATEPSEVDPQEQVPAALEGIYKVMSATLTIRSNPTGKLVPSFPVATIRRGDEVRGCPFEVDGQPWLQLSQQSRELLGLESQRPAYAQINGERLGLGELLRRSPVAPGPEQSAWGRPTLPAQFSPSATSSSDFAQACPVDTDGLNVPEGRWSRFVARLMAGRPLRIPCCLASYWDDAGVTKEEAWRNFLLVMERFPAQDWHAVDPRVGCNEEQARAAVKGIGSLHRAFSGRRMLDGVHWLPLTPLGLEKRAAARALYSDCLHGLLLAGALQAALTPVALETLSKLSSSDEAFGAAVARLVQPPLTLLHGDFQPAPRQSVAAWTGLRFSTARQNPACAVLDWQCVSRGRGAYDLASFLALGLDVRARREMEPFLVLLYLEAAGIRGSENSRVEFYDDFRAGLLATAVFFLQRHAGTLAGGPEVDPAANQVALLGLHRLSVAIEDWNAIQLLGGISCQDLAFGEDDKDPRALPKYKLKKPGEPKRMPRERRRMPRDSQEPLSPAERLLRTTLSTLRK